MRATDILLRPYRKLRLTVKDVNKGYYKGTRTGSMGRHTKKGGYIIEYEKVRTYVVPSLTGFDVSVSLSLLLFFIGYIADIAAHTLCFQARPCRVWCLPRG